MANGDAVFFDIGETLGAVFDEAGAPVPRLQAYSWVPPVLERLQRDGALLGLISNTGRATASDVDGMLERAGLLRYFPHGELRIYSSVVNLNKDRPAIFQLALGRTLGILGRAPGTTVFVGESRAERIVAVQGGMKAAPHPMLAADVLAGGIPTYLLLRMRRDEVPGLADLLFTAGVVPLHCADVGADTEIVALATDRSVAPLQGAGVTVETLPGQADAVGDDLYLLRALPQSRGFAAVVAEGVKPVRETGAGIIAAIPSKRSIDDFHIGAGHGHNLKLLGDPTLLLRRVSRPNFVSFEADGFEAATLAPEEVVTLAETITEQRFEQMLRFVAGMDGRPDAVGGNRHVLSPQMRDVTDGLIAQFERIGDGAFTVMGHRFEITGREVRDVHGNIVPKRIELYNVIAELPGESDEVVLVTAHLDSTAVGTFGGGYDPEVHEAPGVDDDGSGVAAVLLIAQFMRTIFAGRKPARTLRFALFNAEEQGLIGSGRYARAQAAAGTNIVAVFQMDMIAYNSSAPNNFEAHAGTSSESSTPADPAVEGASLRLANLTRDMAEMLAAEGLSILTPAQQLASPDPAAGRSDHASFHDRGYAAIAVSEDFFPTPGNPEDRNPNYHMVSDRIFDVGFATSIARVICAAALRTAHPVATRSFTSMIAMATSSSLSEVSGRLVPIDGALPAAGTVALRAAGAHSAGTVAEAAIGRDGSFAMRAAPGSYHLVARAADGALLASTHETPIVVEASRPVHLVLDAKRPPPLTDGTADVRRAALFPETTFAAAGLADITPDAVLDLARAMITPASAEFGTQFNAPGSAARASNSDDDPMRTLCGTERLRKIDRLAELQGYADPAIVKLRVLDILAMGESGFASRTHTTPNFVITYQTDGPAAVENDLSDFEVMEPGAQPPRVLERLPGGSVPAYVRLVAFWLERSLKFYTSPPFSMRNPAANGRLSAFINAASFGSAGQSGFFINNALPADLVCAVAVHELFHMVQFSYDGPGAWRNGLIEGGATFAEDTVADLMNRYLDEAGANFNGIGLLANPNQSLFSPGARYKSSLFWRYLAEQRSRLVDEPTIGVDAYRRVIEECAENGYTTESVNRAIRSLPFDAELCAFTYAAGMGDVPASSETSFGNFALACYLKDLATPDARFGFRENKENIHIDDVVRLVIPGAPSTGTLVAMKRERGRVSKAGPTVVFQGQVEALASRLFEVEIDADVDTIDVNFSAGAPFSGLIQIVAIDQDGRVRDIVRSDKRACRRRLANALNGLKLSTVAVIISGGEGGGTVQLSLQSAAAVADVMITRWNSESGREYHLDPRGAAWTWVSPDLWFEPTATGDFVVKARLHNKGNKTAENVSCAFAYRPGAADPGDEAPWLPVVDTNGAPQRIDGERIEAGDVREFSLPWRPASAASDNIFTLRAEVACPDDANAENNVAFSRLGVTPAAPGGFAALTMTPELARFARDGAIAAVARPQAERRTLFGVAAPHSPGQAMLRTGTPAGRRFAATAIDAMMGVADADEPSCCTLPGKLATCSALTMRLHRPDGSLAPGATMFFVEEGNEAHAAFGMRATPDGMAALAPLSRRGTGLFASEFWGISRHEAIAAAAEPLLNANAAAAVAGITAPLGDNFPFSGLAGWADKVKRAEPRPGDDEDTVAFLSDPRNRANDTWHYVNIPCHADGYDRIKYPGFTRDDDVVQMIAAAVRVLAGGSDRFSALNALRLVIHLVGDVHQPIHVGCSYIDRSTEPARLVFDPQVAASRGLQHDRGGGRLLLPAAGNLHGYWDGRLGSVTAGNDRGVPPQLRSRFVQKLVDLTQASPEASAGFLASGDPERWAEQWATESLMAAREAYVSLRITGASGSNYKVSWEGKPGYDARCKPIATARLTAAVRNLAALLNRIFG